MNAARQKVEAEGKCRACPTTLPAKLEAAHSWNRGQGGAGFDEPDAIVPLCVPCHRRYDAHQLDLLPHLTLDEQVSLVRYAGGIERARDRAIGRASASPPVAPRGPFAA